MKENKENLGEGDLSVKGFIEKVKDKIPFVKKTERVKEEALATTQSEAKAPDKSKEFEFKQKPSGPFQEFMKTEGLEKLEAIKKKRLEDAEKALADFENKYSEKYGKSNDPKDREAYKFKLNLLKEEVAFIKKHFDLL